MFAHKTTSEEQKKFLESVRVREITKFILQNRALLHSVSRKVGSLLHCCCCCIVGCFAVVMMMIREKRRRFSTCYPKVSHNGSLRPKPTSHSPKGGEGGKFLCCCCPLSCGQFLEGRSLVSRMECGFFVAFIFWISDAGISFVKSWESENKRRKRRNNVGNSDSGFPAFELRRKIHNILIFPLWMWEKVAPATLKIRKWPLAFT